MKLILLVASFFLGNFKNLFKAPGVGLTKQIVLTIRSIVVVVLSSLGSLALFCTGLAMFISNLSSQLDQGGEMKLSAGMVLTFLLSVVSLGVLLFNLREKTWLKATGFNVEEPAPSKGSPIESAVALLITEFVKERESRREKSSSEN